MSTRDLNAYVRVDEKGKQYIYQPREYEFKKDVKNWDLENYTDEVERAAIFDFLNILPTEQLKILTNFDVIDPEAGVKNKSKRISTDELQHLFLRKSKQIRLKIIV